MKRFWTAPSVGCAVGILLSASLSAQVTHADTSVVPLAYESLDAPEGNGFPFGATSSNPGSFPSQRYQQVYGSSAFTSVTSDLWITALEFRRDIASTSPESATNSSIQIDLSTTAAAADGLSAVFDDNVGEDAITVFSGTITFSGPTAPPPSGVHDWDFVVPLQTAFLYRPSEGNLLMDVRNFALASGTIIFDSANDSDAISRVFTGPGQTVSSSSGLTDSRGLVARVVFVPAVEPECGDSADNDGDGLIDFNPDPILSDPGCTDAQDPSENDPDIPCDDGIDNDGDQMIDLADLGCGGSPISVREDPACQDGQDNDSDGRFDFDGGMSIWGELVGPPDPDCSAYRDQTERKPCGLGFELALVMPVLIWLRSRRRRA